MLQNSKVWIWYARQGRQDVLLFCLSKNTVEKLEQGRMAVQAIYYPSVTYGRSNNKITWALFCDIS